MKIKSLFTVLFACTALKAHLAPHHDTGDHKDHVMKVHGNWECHHHLKLISIMQEMQKELNHICCPVVRNADKFHKMIMCLFNETSLPMPSRAKNPISYLFMDLRITADYCALHLKKGCPQSIYNAMQNLMLALSKQAEYTMMALGSSMHCGTHSNGGERKELMHSVKAIVKGLAIIKCYLRRHKMFGEIKNAVKKSIASEISNVSRH